MEVSDQGGLARARGGVEEVIAARLVIFCAMAAMFVASLAVPSAFGHFGVLFGSAYFVVQLLHLLLYACGNTCGEFWVIHQSNCSLVFKCLLAF
jgi:low temperature requirement protein LtrA